MKHSIALLILAAGPMLAADAALMNLVPPDATVVAGIRIDNTANSKLGQHLLSQMKDEDAGFRGFIQATGFDPRRDLRELIIASTAAAQLAAQSGAQKGRGLVLARGVFDVPRIFALAKTAGAPLLKYQGLDVLANSGAGWVVFPDNSTAIAGDPQMVKSALDRRQGGAPLDAGMAAKVNEFSGRYDIWMVSSAPVSQFAGRMPDRQLSGAMKGDMLRGIEQTSGGIRFGTIIQVGGEAVTRSEKDAAALLDVVKFLTGMLQLNREKPDAAKFATLLDTLELKSEANVMKFNLSVPEADVEKLLTAPKAPARRATATL
ncbi:MAG TPA: hypothetical protein VMZ52_07660 [Bryobacteraceae bacterium]|nr:hypothetical protein [Bryobacteraceae bacterium]